MGHSLQLWTAAHQRSPDLKQNDDLTMQRVINSVLFVICPPEGLSDGACFIKPYSAFGMHRKAIIVSAHL